MASVMQTTPSALAIHLRPQAFSPHCATRIGGQPGRGAGESPNPRLRGAAPLVFSFSLLVCSLRLRVIFLLYSDKTRQKRGGVQGELEMRALVSRSARAPIGPPGALDVSSGWKM